MPTPPSVPQKIDRAFFVKLGRGGKWEAECISRGILRFGWSANPLSDILAGNWSKIKRDLDNDTADTNRLKNICTATSSDVWITFFDSKMYWCQLSDKLPDEDEISKFRHTQQGWTSQDRTGKELIASQIPGVISAVRGYRATVCSVKYPAVLGRVIRAEPSPVVQAVNGAKTRLEEELVVAIQQLHWKDFETLVDLIYRAGGWKRISVLGETTKATDLELEEPITGSRYQVQIKSKSSKAEFLDYASQFKQGSFRRLYFIVHSPDAALMAYKGETPNVELITAPRLASMTVDAGLVDWLMMKVW